MGGDRRFANAFSVARLSSGCELSTESLIRSASAGELHEVAPIWRQGVRIVRCLPTAPALVLGSRQTDDIVDRSALEREGLVMFRRRSGGGAVLVDASHSVWIDIEIGVEDPRYCAEPMSMMAEVGRWWMKALAALNCCPPDIWQFEGAMECDAGGDVICFAGRAHGELMVGESKLVGLSQRRTRDGARVQGQLHFGDPTDVMMAVLAEHRTHVRRPALLPWSSWDIIDSDLLAALTTAAA